MEQELDLDGFYDGIDLYDDRNDPDADDDNEYRDDDEDEYGEGFLRLEDLLDDDFE